MKKVAFYGLKKHLRGKKSLIRLFEFLCFCLGIFMIFVLFCAFCTFFIFSCMWNLSVKKINKDVQTALITSFTLLIFYVNNPVIPFKNTDFGNLIHTPNINPKFNKRLSRFNVLCIGFHNIRYLFVNRRT